MDNDSSLPDGIGPHEGQELELMLRGEKPAAMFYDTYPDSDYPIPEEGFQPYVDNGRIVKKEALYPSSIPKEAQRKDINVTHTRYVFYALPDEAWRLNELDEINRNFYLYNKPWHDELDRKTGELLGYSEEQIIAFLAHKNRIRI